MSMLEWMSIMYSVACYGPHDRMRQENTNVVEKKTYFFCAGINCSFIQCKCSNLSVLKKKQLKLHRMSISTVVYLSMSVPYGMFISEAVFESWNKSGATVWMTEMFLQQWGSVFILLNKCKDLSVSCARSLSCAVLPTSEHLQTQKPEVARTGAKIGLFSKAQLSAW